MLVIQESNRAVLKTCFFPFTRIYLLFEIGILGKRRKAKLKKLLKKPKMKTQKTG